ncbi:GIY-YIG nuclease family protein [Candidatus Parcubacteria bacterium]|nr:MAG: GIY-YIG nuclease family protein [Candidatus Parcubacteria bacterium]
MKSYVYILRDRGGRFYVGSTTDIDRRLKQHSSGQTQTTRNMKEPALVLLQEYPSRPAAWRAERKIKNFKRRDFIEKMVRDGYVRVKL